MIALVLLFTNLTYMDITDVYLRNIKTRTRIQVIYY